MALTAAVTNPISHGPQKKRTTLKGDLVLKVNCAMIASTLAWVGGPSLSYSSTPRPYGRSQTRAATKRGREKKVRNIIKTTVVVITELAAQAIVVSVEKLGDDRPKL